MTIPLPERMRPRSLAEVRGQEHLLAPGRPLARLLDVERLPSLLLWGPPGTGKTTLARLLAQHVAATFESLSAVMDGVPRLREVVAAAEARRKRDPLARTLLFVDEIHRFHKGQQDALLPHVENGLLTLIGATTENPSFEVNGALSSRCALFVLHPLGDGALGGVIDEALSDRERGLGNLGLTFAPEARAALIRFASGDARRALLALERVGAQHRARPFDAPPLAVEDVAAALDEKSLRHDRSGDDHYAVVSALIKSMRASDPDAALYWLARMVEAGEDLLFIARRLVIFASEDVGLADPRALQIAVAARDAAHMVGLPEARFPLSQAVLYLATAPKSGSAKGYFEAAQKVAELGALPVPLHLRKASTPLMKAMGYGKGYQSPHGTSREWVKTECLPDELRGARFYHPTEQGYEKTVAERVNLWRKWKQEAGK